MNAEAQAVVASRFVKIGSSGERLPPSAPEWVAVFDEKTGLTWHAQELDECESQQQAERAAAELTAAGFRWRLSTREELLTLVDDTRHNPAIDTAFFPACRSDWYWTSTPAAFSPADCAWSVYFDGGGASWGGQDVGGFVRAVRASQ